MNFLGNVQEISEEKSMIVPTNFREIAIKLPGNFPEISAELPGNFREKNDKKPITSS